MTLAALNDVVLNPGDLSAQYKTYDSAVKKLTSQFDKAVEAFGKQRFLMLVGDRQVESLDEELMLGVETEITFLKLVPLVGG